jgi:hypothetical protein
MAQGVESNPRARRGSALGAAVRVCSAVDRVTRCCASQHLAGLPGRSWTEGLPSCDHGVTGRGEDPAIFRGADRIKDSHVYAKAPFGSLQRLIPWMTLSAVNGLRIAQPVTLVLLRV